MAREHYCRAHQIKAGPIVAAACGGLGTRQTGDVRLGRRSSCNPLVIDGVPHSVTTAQLRVAAVDAATGRELLALRGRPKRTA